MEKIAILYKNKDYGTWCIRNRPLRENKKSRARYKNYKYEISLVEQGIKKKPGKKYYEKLIEDKKDEIGKIRESIKK